MAMRDTRVAYGARCTWWDSVHLVGTMDGTSTGLPCCPNCKGVLFEMDNEEAWWERARTVENDRPDLIGYAKFLAWARGKCFPSFTDAWNTWDEQGRP